MHFGKAFWRDEEELEGEVGFFQIFLGSALGEQKNCTSK